MHTKYAFQHTTENRLDPSAIVPTLAAPSDKWISIIFELFCYTKKHNSINITARVTKVVPMWPVWPSDQCVQTWNRSVQNYGLEDRKTVSSDAQFPRYDHFEKKLCHHEEGPPFGEGPPFVFLVLSSTVRADISFLFRLRRTVFEIWQFKVFVMYCQWGFCDPEPHRTETQNSMKNSCAKNTRRIFKENITRTAYNSVILNK